MLRVLSCCVLSLVLFFGAAILSCHGPWPYSTGHGRLDVPPSWPFSIDSGKAVSHRGMVATDAQLATQVGVRILERGGNAVDAAIAVAFALAVVLPSAGNIGGGGFMVARMADGSSYALDFRETAPSAATRNMYLDSSGQMSDQSLTGHLAAGVPGTVAGLSEAHKKFGTLYWADLVTPAIQLAAEGFPASSGFVDHIRGDSARLVRYPASARLFLPNGHPPIAGDTWKNTDLAETLRHIAEEGSAGFYEGTTARLILQEMKRGKGIITQRDLRSYRAVWRTPITTEYRGHTIISMPPPSSGGITLAMIAHMVEEYSLNSLGWHSPDALHLVVESMRRAYADRNHYLGDPSFVDIPADTLLSRAYARHRGSSIHRDQATPSSEISAGNIPTLHEGTHTTHFSVVDSAGNAVALTYTINTGFGSAVTVSGAGFLLNNEMDDFASKPGSQNTFGLVQGEANAIQPGKRMLSSMTPTIVVDPMNQVVLITGASGGPRITTSTFQVISNALDFGMDIAEAVNTPRFHHQHLPDTILLEEGGFPQTMIELLRSRGHVTRMVRHLAISSSIARKDSHWEGCADPRGGGSAGGY